MECINIIRLITLGLYIIMLSGFVVELIGIIVNYEKLVDIGFISVVLAGVPAIVITMIALVLL